MIINGLKNYFKSLKYFFVPLGTLFLGLLIGLSVLYFGVKSQISYVAENVNKIIQTADIDFNELSDSLISDFAGLSWDDPLDTVKYIFETDWLAGKLNGFIEKTAEKYSEYSGQVTGTVATAVNNLTSYFAIFILLAVLGLLGGFYLTKYLIRKDIAKRSLFKFIFIYAVDSLLSVTVVALALWLLSLWQPSIYISAFLTVVLYSYIALLEAYLVHGHKKVPFRKVINIKNVLLLLVSNFIIVLITGAFIYLLNLLTNIIVAVIIGLSLATIAFIVISLNSEAYVVKIKNGINCERKRSNPA